MFTIIARRPDFSWQSRGMVASICSKIVCATLFALAIPTASAGSAQAANPSFDCRKARRPDEQTICKDSRLAELDQAVTMAFRQATKGFKKEARDAAKETLKLGVRAALIGFAFSISKSKRSRSIPISDRRFLFRPGSEPIVSISSLRGPNRQPIVSLI
jgi:hypothetical protein